MRLEENPQLPQNADSPYAQASNQVLSKLFRAISQKVNQLADGRIVANDNALTTAPTSGQWNRGDIVRNTAPTGTTPTWGWICTAAGTPGTWIALFTGSGGGTPGGATTQIQYNNAGAFAGDSGMTYTLGTQTAGFVNVTYTGLALTAASTTTSAGVRLPHGAAPTTPTNGDLWSTTAGFFGRVNGATVGPFGAGAAASTAKIQAYLNTATNTVSTGWQKVPLDATSYDTATLWDSVNKRIVPKQAGYYMVSGRLRTNANVTVLSLGIGFNGSQVQGLGAATASGGTMNSTGGSTLIFCNGTTDYLELFSFFNVVTAYTTGAFDTYINVYGPI